MQRLIWYICLLIFSCDVRAVTENLKIVDDPNNSVELGRSIFETGMGRDGRTIGATLHGVPLSGVAIACSGCHGRDARGGGEAFIIAPDIRWSNLSKLYPARRAGGAGKSYDSVTFAKAIRDGISADGRTLDPAMPRIDLADDEIRSLIAYLSEIDQQTVSTRARFRIISLMPVSGLNRHADTLIAKLNECATSSTGKPFAAIETIYFATPENAIRNLEDRLQKSTNTLILTPFIMGWEEKYYQVARLWNAPTVLPFTFLDPPVRQENSFERNWFFYFPGLQSQLKALMASIQKEKYLHARIVSDPMDELSIKLKDYVLLEAERLGISILPDQRENSDTQVSKYAVIWLIPTTPDLATKQFAPDVDTLMLAPVFYFTPGNVSVAGNHTNTLKWRIAYPYNPVTLHGQWLSPVDAWTGAACAFLTRMSDEESNSNILQTHIEWGADFKLPAKPDREQLSNTVFIRDYYE